MIVVMLLGCHTLLAAGAVKHILLICVARDQAVDRHVLRLADPVAARHGLQVVLRAGRPASVRIRALSACGLPVSHMSLHLCYS